MYTQTTKQITSEHQRHMTSRCLAVIFLCVFSVLFHQHFWACSGQAVGSGENDAGAFTQTQITCGQCVSMCENSICVRSRDADQTNPQTFLASETNAALFPRTLQRLQTPDVPIERERTGQLDTYFGHMVALLPSRLAEIRTLTLWFVSQSVLNQLAEMASQINHDIRHLSNHKYIAHQMALLYVRGVCCVVFRLFVCFLGDFFFFFFFVLFLVFYFKKGGLFVGFVGVRTTKGAHNEKTPHQTHAQQCLAQAPGDLSDFRAQVEQRFPALKAATKANADADTLQPVLPTELAEWVLQVTAAIANEVFSLAVPEFAAPMGKIMDAVHAAA
jgi:hypothetical protein